jgi:putative acetyltransferase
MKGPHFTIRPVQPGDAPAIRAIVLAALREWKVDGRPNPLEDADLEDLPGFYGRAGSAYFVAEGPEVLGGAGLGPLPGMPDACELRKMYVAPQARGQGIGRALGTRCLEAAREKGYRWCYLNTLRRMQPAILLYLSLGFEETDPPPGDDPSGCDCWYRIGLGS